MSKTRRKHTRDPKFKLGDQVTVPRGVMLYSPAEPGPVTPWTCFSFSHTRRSFYADSTTVLEVRGIRPCPDIMGESHGYILCREVDGEELGVCQWEFELEKAESA